MSELTTIPTPLTQKSRRLRLLRGLLGEMYQATAPNQCPSGDALDKDAQTWDHLLRDVPDEQLNDLFNAALEEHMRGPRASFPMPAYTALRLWESAAPPPPVTHGFRAWRAALGLLPHEMSTPGPVLTDEWRRRFPVRDVQEPSDD